MKMDKDHPEYICGLCGGKNIVWYAPSPLWNHVVRQRGKPEVLCPDCFDDLCNDLDITIIFKTEIISSPIGNYDTLIKKD